MSKAFVKDDGVENGEDEDPPLPVGSVAGSLYITRLGSRQLQEELEHLWHVERPRVTLEVQTAAAQGDRSENAEYIYGKKRLREIDRRLRFLSKRIDTLTVVTPSPEQRGRVFFGAFVRVVDEEGEETTYRIVGGDEVDVARGDISVDAPIAKALLGKREGEEVNVRRPKGEMALTIARIWYDDAL
ncbi:MAG: transcription elongation factor GreB [Polyangiales bacterium]